MQNTQFGVKESKLFLVYKGNLSITRELISNSTKNSMVFDICSSNLVNKNNFLLKNLIVNPETIVDSDTLKDDFETFKNSDFFKKVVLINQLVISRSPDAVLDFSPKTPSGIIFQDKFVEDFSKSFLTPK